MDQTDFKSVPLGEASVSATPHEGLRNELAELLDVVGPAQLGNVVLERAFEVNATDIHFEPTPSGLRIRMRVDGLLHDVARLPMIKPSPLIQRLKVLAGMDISERRHSQDGRISHQTMNGPRDIRVGSGPTLYGERLVLRLMPVGSTFDRLDGLGLENGELSAVRRCLSAPYGLILLTGPMGSGKSTSVYSFLHEIHHPQKSIVTIEDPVERRIDDICQIQIEPKIGFHFVEALRCVLRQDPDVMMVGEIRDAETAQIACRSALSGVLVLSTLHAHNTAAAVDVLEDFGVPRVIIADCLRGIISQRLILQVCKQHREVYHPEEAVCQMLGIDPANAESVNLVRGIPADVNFHTGYSGRTGIFEIMEMNKDLRRAILRGESASELMEIAQRNGMKTLHNSLRNKILSGVTSLDQFHAATLTLGD